MKELLCLAVAMDKIYPRNRNIILKPHNGNKTKAPCEVQHKPLQTAEN